MRDKTPQSLWIEDLDNFLEELEVGCVVKSFLNEMSIHSFAINCKVCRISDRVVEYMHARRNINCPQASRAFIFPHSQSKILDKEEFGYKSTKWGGVHPPIPPCPTLAWAMLVAREQKSC